MDLDQQNLFKKLLEKLNFKDPSELKGLKNGALTKLIIHTRSNRWTLFITLPTVIPYKSFLTFEHQLHSVFNFLSGINLIIQTSEPKVTSSLVLEYWPWVVKHCDLSASMVHQLIKYGHLKQVGTHVAVDTKNEALRDLLTDGAMVPIENEYYLIGFPRLKIDVLGGKKRLPAKIVDFPIKKNSRDIKLARKADQALDDDSSK